MIEIDLFAGTGALGFEALSRGADYCLFLDNDGMAQQTIRANGEALGLSANTKIYHRDIHDLGVRTDSFGDPFELVFLDPPYGKNLASIALNKLAPVSNWLSPGAIIIAEISSRDRLTIPEDFQTIDDRQFGDTHCVFLQAKIDNE